MTHWLSKTVFAQQFSQLGIAIVKKITTLVPCNQRTKNYKVGNKKFKYDKSSAFPLATFEII